MARLRYNGLTTTLGASLTDSATAVTFGAALTHSGGAAVPTISGGNYIPLTILDATGDVSEIVHLTAYTAAATTGTIVRGREGTTGVAHDSGDDMVHAPTVSDVSALPTIDVVVDHGAKVDGTTDDTVAWQAAIDAAAAAGGGRIISSRNGVSVIGGALQDTGNANAQIILPEIDYGDTECVSIAIEGTIAPPPVASVTGATPLPDGHLILKSTLNAGTGAMIGGRKASGSLDNFTNVMLSLRNLTVRMPANPVLTGLNLSKVAAVALDQVWVDASSYDADGLTEPTTTTSYGIRLPAINNGAMVKLGVVNVIGFYNGLEYSEHANGQEVSAWACKRAHVFTAANHGSSFQRLNHYHCTRGVVFTGTHYVEVDLFNIEHAAAATGWQETVYDIDDASNFGHGSLRWSVVLADVGQDDTFTVNGATGILAGRVGTTSSPATIRDRVVADAGDDTLTLGGTPVTGSELVWVDNVIQWPGTDYTIADNVITFDTPLAAADVVLCSYQTFTDSPAAASLSNPTVYVADTFDRADNASSMGSTSTGSAAWTSLVGTWGIQSNRAYISAGVSALTCLASVECGIADGTISTTIATATSTSNSGLTFRVTDVNNLYVLEGGNGSTTAKIYKRVSGTFTQIAESAGNVHFNAGDVISVVLSGSSIIAKQNGTTIVSVTDSTHLTQTKHGLYHTAAASTAGVVTFESFATAA